MDGTERLLTHGSLVQDRQGGPGADHDELAISMLLLQRTGLIGECLARSLKLELPKCRVVAWTGPLDDETLSQFDMAVVVLTMDAHRRRVPFEKFGELAKKLPVVVISDHEDSAFSQDMLRTGVRAHVLSSSDLRSFVNILRIIRNNGTYFPISILDADEMAKGAFRAAGNSDISILTPREIDILRLLGEGKQNKIIAYELDICESTVKVHIRHIMGKVGAINRTQAALVAKEMLGDEF
jgi:DNA-binding NarL/FixJ family response regulator